MGLLLILALLFRLSATIPLLFVLCLFIGALINEYILQGEITRKIWPKLCWMFSWCCWVPVIWLNVWRAFLGQIELNPFVLDFIFRYRIFIFAIGGSIYLLGIYILLRLIWTWSLGVQTNLTFKQAIQRSWKLTRQNFPFKLTLLVIVIFFSRFFVWHMFTRLPNFIALAGNLLLQGVLCALFWYARLKIVAPKALKFKKSGVKEIIIISILICLNGLILMCNVLPNTSKLQIIAHKGVANVTAVPNSLVALKQTALHVHPDFVEIDVRVTKDNNFIVSHDDKLLTVAGKNISIKQQTATNLQKLSIKQGDKATHLTTLTHYLQVAKALNQPVLIELKSEQLWSNKVIADFIKRYGAMISQNHWKIHTMNYRLLRKIKQMAPQLKIGYVEPFTLFAPKVAKADFLSLNQTLLLSSQTQRLKKAFYVWTVNQKGSAQMSQTLGATAIITDKTSLLQRISRNNNMKLKILLKEI